MMNIVTFGGVYKPCTILGLEGIRRGFISKQIREPILRISHIDLSVMIAILRTLKINAMLYGSARAHAKWKNARRAAWQAAEHGRNNNNLGDALKSVDIDSRCKARIELTLA
jgi:hypothetical protein